MKSTTRPDTVPETVVFGLGLSGYSVLRYLHDRGEAAWVTDTRARPTYRKRLSEHLPDTPFIPYASAQDMLSRVQRVILSPGIDPQLPPLRAARDAGVEIIGDIELFARAAPAPLLAITGSNGKSTVTTLCGELLAAAGARVLVGGNLGTPALDLLAEAVPDFYVLELSSFQLECTYNLEPMVAALLNLSADHLDRYPDMAAYTAAKARIFNGARQVLVNRSDASVCRLAGGLRRSVSFGRDAPPGSVDFGVVPYQGEAWLAQGPRRLLPLQRLQIPGSHNALNVLAALALTALAGRPLSAPVLECACRFSGLAHRCELVRRRQGVAWINDSKGTNAGATLAAMQGFGQPLVWIGGGLGKGTDFAPLVRGLAARAHTVILIGQAAEEIATALRESGTQIPMVYREASLEAAVQRAAGNARPGDTVLFSPACASFDMFQNYQHRGDVFRRLVEAMPE